jgi:hypothetical protein
MTENLLDSQRPETVKEQENSGPGQWRIAVVENLSTLDPLIERLDGASQEREGRLRGIQNLKPAAPSAPHSRSRASHFERHAIHKLALRLIGRTADIRMDDSNRLAAD